MVKSQIATLPKLDSWLIEKSVRPRVEKDDDITGKHSDKLGKDCTLVTEITFKFWVDKMTP